MKHHFTRLQTILGQPAPRSGQTPRFILVFLVAALSVAVWDLTAARGTAQARAAVPDAQAVAVVATPIAPSDAYGFTRARWQDDAAAMKAFRPGYDFWQHIFTIPDGSIAFGSAVDGRLLAVFPAAGDWARAGRYVDPALADLLDSHELPRRLDDRRDLVVRLLEQATGAVLHNPTRGQFLLPNAEEYGSFLGEWGAIYERFGVPADIGLAQAVLESGLNGQRKSKAGAVGFCQWLRRNWKVLDAISPATLEAQNQTTQAPYCAAYLTVLATKYQSFIPALSEHHSGGTNVGRTIINGGRLGGASARERYFLGAQFARDVRALATDKYRDLYRTYGPRSYLYAEMTFGNGHNIRRLTSSMPQTKIYAMRTDRAIPIAEIRRRTLLSEKEIRRFNPALLKKVPAGATIYLPMYVQALGRDVSFWHEAPGGAFVSVLNEFVRLDATVEQWEDRSFERVLRDFQRRFAATDTEEGSVMATILGYASQEAYTSTRSAILADFRNSEEIRALFASALQQREAARLAVEQMR